MKIKICGLTRREDVETALSLGVDALGFILADSPRKVSLEDVSSLVGGLPPFSSTVAVVANPSESELEEIVSSRLFDCVQFHGSESPEIVASVPIKTIKAFGIASKEDLDEALSYGGADWLLLDGRVGRATGGTGRPFDWKMLRGRETGRPWILAGGLGPDNLEKAVRTAMPPAVDLNSALETAPGIKDGKKMARAVEIVRALEGEEL
ncbi:phosphoribosylanthranilate isomerase [Dethiosulfovibrio sp. F2B]|uniref:phosphoribosylanthranilate isomerase n=1 Tax=Dethiosulfovibrio faecalis TaxID=2720018 RepID=UPI001F2A5731|nr:phosphoribosylanthranilate isomerase [Dethiosulfovibrio faecalis]